jgi:hypothetical protein
MLNLRDIIFVFVFGFLGIAWITGSMNYNFQSLEKIPVVINTWPFINATQSGKNNDFMK